MTTLPSSPKDFAFYQSQRMRAAAPVGDAEEELAAFDTEAAPVDAFAEDAEPDFVLVDPDADPIEEAVAVTEAGSLVDDGDGWGGATPAAGDETVVQTAVANTTSVTEVYEEGLRYKPDGDIFVRVLVERTLQSLDRRERPDRGGRRALRAGDDGDPCQGEAQCRRHRRHPRGARRPRQPAAHRPALALHRGHLHRHAGPGGRRQDPSRRRSLGARRSLQSLGRRGSRPARPAVPAARRDLLDRGAQRGADRRPRRGDHAAVAQLRPRGLRLDRATS